MFLERWEYVGSGGEEAHIEMSYTKTLWSININD
jgi:hypothetical protein